MAFQHWFQMCKLSGPQALMQRWIFNWVVITTQLHFNPEEAASMFSKKKKVHILICLTTEVFPTLPQCIALAQWHFWIMFTCGLFFGWESFNLHFTMISVRVPELIHWFPCQNHAMQHIDLWDLQISAFYFYFYFAQYSYFFWIRFLHLMQ